MASSLRKLIVIVLIASLIFIVTVIGSTVRLQSKLIFTIPDNQGLIVFNHNLFYDGALFWESPDSRRIFLLNYQPGEYSETISPIVWNDQKEELTIEIKDGKSGSVLRNIVISKVDGVIYSTRMESLRNGLNP